MCASFNVSLYPVQLADDQGMVLMTTVAMPVFSKENETVSAMAQSGQYFIFSFQNTVYSVISVYF